MYLWRLCILFLIISLPGASSEEAGQDMRELVPKEVAAWKARESDGVYDRKTLYDYIDGGAEVYLAYDFRACLARRFEKEGAPNIIADIFDMGSASDAYGIFTFEREGSSVMIGQDSEYTAGLLRFWKGRYFVSILTEQETPESKQAVMDLGKVIASRILNEGVRPKIVSMLPLKNLQETSIRYFHQKSGLDFHYYLADKNVLNLGKQTEAVLAQYGEGKTKHFLLIVRYPDRDKASSAFTSFRAAYMPDAGKSNVLRTEDGRWVAAKCEKEFFVGVFEAPSRAQAVALLRAVDIGREEKER